jgi:hypothetical protein
LLQGERHRGNHRGEWFSHWASAVNGADALANMPWFGDQEITETAATHTGSAFGFPNFGDTGPIFVYADNSGLLSGFAAFQDPQALLGYHIGPIQISDDAPGLVFGIGSLAIPDSAGTASLLAASCAGLVFLRRRAEVLKNWH